MFECHITHIFYNATAYIPVKFHVLRVEDLNLSFILAIISQSPDSLMAGVPAFPPAQLHLSTVTDPASWHILCISRGQEPNVLRDISENSVFIH